ncbi:MAG: hypothetical protein NTW87_18015 [Planctomycetota bacterium]|nr:hypothetical protein [Planctomycetota bacterium]
MDLTTDTSADLADLIAVAEERLRDFQALRKAGCYAGAVYVGRYAVEVFLKCLICRRLGKTKLPVIFHSHNLAALLFFAGLNEELEEKQPRRFASFKEVRGQRVDQLRYQNPARVGVSDCNNWERWLNDKREGIVPWLRKKCR